MPNYKQRVELTEVIENSIQDLFLKDKCTVKEFGCKSILGDDGELWDFIKEPLVNQQASALIVKFAPDFIILKKSNPKELFFIDVKHSTTPIWSPNRLKMLRDKNNDSTLTTDRVGVIAREALLAYKRYYPNTIVLMASPYNSKLLMAQFAKDIKCLYCYHSPNRKEYDCSNCPSDNGGFFDIERDVNSDGSKTPMTNVDFDSFLQANEFFDEIGIQLNSKTFEDLCQIIKKESIEIADDVYPDLKKRTLWNIAQSGCDWVDYEVYSIPGNAYYHVNKECKYMKGNEKSIVNYATLEQAKLFGKKTHCRKCCPKVN